MRVLSGSLRLSATDLSNHLHCHHLTQLDLAVARGERDKADHFDPRAEVLRDRGYEHEARYLEQLRAEGRRVVRVEYGEDSTSVARTVGLMREGVEVIAQGALAADGWFGRPDVLQRVEEASDLGAWGYEATDTKLARETRGATVLQLCLYSELIAAVQGRLPVRMHVVSPGAPLAPETLRVRNYLAYHRFVRRELHRAVDGRGPATYPEPVDHCQVCAYWRECDARWRADDHLSLVADVTRGQRRELEERSIDTLARLAKEPIPLAWRPGRGSAVSYEKAREQARVQLEGRRRGEPYFEVLAVDAGRGLARLPEPHSADVFFDFEGDPFAGEAGLEYLFGWARVDAGEPGYEHLWAANAEQEKEAFERFVDAMADRLERHPGFHIYHFGHYEESTLKRLMGRYATREAEVDRLLRGDVLVDLHLVVRQALRAAVERYSLKDLEAYCGFARGLELREARSALFRVERLLELGQGAEISEADRRPVLDYNRDDCLSTWWLRDWLEELRRERVEAGERIPRPEAGEEAASDKVKERDARVAAVMGRLLRGVPVEAAQRSREQQATWVLAHLADYHRRENKVNWWDYFRLRDLGEEELLDEPAGLAGLAFEGEVEGAGKNPVHRYRFPRQEVRLRRRTDARFGDTTLGTVVSFDLGARSIDLRKRGDAVGEHPRAVFLHTDIPLGQKPVALLEFAEAVAESGWEGDGAHRATRDLLLRRPPRLTEGAGPLARGPGESILGACKRLASGLDGGVLPIQGPPGSGKTYVGARMAVELVRQGRRVGVTATGHKVARNFLHAALEAAAEARLPLRCAHKTEPSDEDDPRILVLDSYPKLRSGLGVGEIDLLAGTAWLWARGDFEGAVDVLFIDEAGQMALADVVASARGAKSLVLLGDPQQLEQPQQGSHPEGTHVSALQHLLGDAETLPAGAGLFLGETYRLHPSLCDFTSELFYEGRLSPVAGLERQRLSGPVLDGAGLFFLPVEHEGNQSSSAEEVEVIGRWVERLIDGSTTWTDQQGGSTPLAAADILIVAPYNAQVQALQERLPGARIGTVDKFQGQEAPLVIFSTATSSPDLAPRGMEFLYDSSRLNVATSRARAACVLVGCPQLFEPECRTPRQIQLANAFCRYLEVARPVAVES